MKRKDNGTMAGEWYDRVAAVLTQDPTRDMVMSAVARSGVMWPERHGAWTSATICARVMRKAAEVALSASVVGGQAWEDARATRQGLADALVYTNLYMGKNGVRMADAVLGALKKGHAVHGESGALPRDISDACALTELQRAQPAWGGRATAGYVESCETLSVAMAAASVAMLAAAEQADAGVWRSVSCQWAQPGDDVTEAAASSLLALAVSASMRGVDLVQAYRGRFREVSARRLATLGLRRVGAATP